MAINTAMTGAYTQLEALLPIGCSLNSKLWGETNKKFYQQKLRLKMFCVNQIFN